MNFHKKTLFVATLIFVFSFIFPAPAQAGVFSNLINMAKQIRVEIGRLFASGPEIQFINENGEKISSIACEGTFKIQSLNYDLNAVWVH